TPSVTPTPVSPSSGSAVIVAIGGRSGSAVAWPSSPLVQAASSPMVDPATAAWTTVRRVITGTPLLTAAVRRSGQTPPDPIKNATARVVRRQQRVVDRFTTRNR